VANCEIYNFQELRERLNAQHRFRSRTDSEVILHLFEERDIDSFSQLDGMFAMALWDEKAQRLVLARDPFGKKPLYYWHQGGRLAFASELPALLSLAETPRSEAEEKLGEYLTLGFVRGPETLIRGVRRLLPGSYLVAEPDKPPAVRRYMELPPIAESEATIEQAEQEVERLLVAAVQKRLMADVPLGAFLSGGIDSSVIVALMGRLSRERIRTFSLGFAEHSELAAAREVARTVGSIHTEILLAPPDPTTIESVLGSYGEPFADSTALAVRSLAAAAGGSARLCLPVMAAMKSSPVPTFRNGAQPALPCSRGLLRILAWWFTATGLPFDPEALAAGCDRRLGEVRISGAESPASSIRDLPYGLPSAKDRPHAMAHGVKGPVPSSTSLFSTTWNLPDSFKLQGVGKQIMRIAGRLLGETIASAEAGFLSSDGQLAAGPVEGLGRGSPPEPFPSCEAGGPRAVRKLWNSHLGQTGARYSGHCSSLSMAARSREAGAEAPGRQGGTPANAA
jgi:hypothetical protein